MPVESIETLTLFLNMLKETEDIISEFEVKFTQFGNIETSLFVRFRKITTKYQCFTKLRSLVFLIFQDFLI